MNNDLTFVTNEKGQNLKQRFEVLIKNTDFFDCLVGYFYASGFHAIYKSLKKTKKTRILIGISTNQQTYEMMQKAKIAEQASLRFSHAETKEQLGPIVEKEMEEGRFRQDLYYRLNVIPLYVPRLTERRDDIPELADHFLKLYSPLKGGRKTITEGAIKKLMQHDWPGNVRELKNIIERLVIMTPGNTITADDIIPLGTRTTTEMDRIFDTQELKDARAEFEKIFIERKLNQCGNNISRTADLIGVERSNLHRKIKSLGIDVE